MCLNLSSGDKTVARCEGGNELKTRLTIDSEERIRTDSLVIPLPIIVATSIGFSLLGGCRQERISLVSLFIVLAS